MSFPFAPKGWMYCQGQLLPIQNNQALYSLLGNTYGGDGRTTFALPDLRGRIIVGVGAGPGLSPYTLGQASGSETVSLNQTQIPPHSHTLSGSVRTGDGADVKQPNGAWPAAGSSAQYTAGASNATLNANALSASLATAGASQPHENRQPTLVLNYAIAIMGVFPARS